jgi:hypothetical protein
MEHNGSNISNQSFRYPHSIQDQEYYDILDRSRQSRPIVPLYSSADSSHCTNHVPNLTNAISAQYNNNVRERLLNINQQYISLQEELRQVGIVQFRDISHNATAFVDDP